MKKEFLFYFSHVITAFVLILWIILISNHKDSQIHFLQHQIDSIGYIQHEIHRDKIDKLFFQHTIDVTKKETIEPPTNELKEQVLTIKIIGGVITISVLIMFFIEFFKACKSGVVFPKYICLFFKRKKNT